MQIKKGFFEKIKNITNRVVDCGEKWVKSGEGGISCSWVSTNTKWIIKEGL